LPIQRAEGFGGYDASEVTAETHHLFEEVPSLGLAADVVMALASHQAEPQLNIRERMSENTRANANFVGNGVPLERDTPRSGRIRKSLELVPHAIQNTSKIHASICDT
jgi:hypothetical protein